MPKVQIANGLNVHYEQVGSGPDVVMVHGIGGNLATWHFKIIPLLWDRYQVLTYDLRGHGYTETTLEGYTPTQLATDLKELMDEVGVEKADIVGHSYGADIALYFAYQYPERCKRVILIEALVPALVPMMTRDDFERADWAAAALEKLGIPIPEERRFDTEYMIRQAMTLPNKWGPLKDMPATWSTDKMIRLYSQTTVLRDALDIGDLTIENIPNVEVPVHLVYDTGSLLWHQAYAFLLEALPNVSSSLLETEEDQIAHFAPLEKPDVVADHIVNALSAPAPSEAAVSSERKG